MTADELAEEAADIFGKKTGSNNVDAYGKKTGSNNVDAYGKKTGSNNVDTYGKKTGSNNVDTYGKKTGSNNVDTYGKKTGSNSAAVDEMESDLIPEGAALTLKQTVIAVPNVYKNSSTEFGTMEDEDEDDEGDFEYIPGMEPPDLQDGQDDGLDKCSGTNMDPSSKAYIDCMNAMAPYENDVPPVVPTNPMETIPDDPIPTDPMTFTDAKGKTFSFEEEDVDTMETIPDDPIPTDPMTFTDAKGKTFSFEEEDVDTMETIPDDPIPTDPMTFTDAKGKTFSFEEEDVDTMETIPDDPIPTDPMTMTNSVSIVSKTVTYQYADGTSVTETVSGENDVKTFTVGGKTFTFEED
jgi:uncharacterized protein YlzI (FlbEa/FlbD family)